MTSPYLAEAARRAALMPNRKVERLVPNPIEGAGAVMHVEVRSSDNCISRVSHNVPESGMSLHAQLTWFGILCAVAIALGCLAALWSHYE